MSFTAEVKKELATVFPASAHCERAELLAFLSNFGETEFDVTALKKACCRRAFLRGMFLSSGLLSDPEAAYRLEILCPNRAIANVVVSTLQSFSVQGKIVSHKRGYIVTVKDGNAIADFLRIVEAPEALFRFEDVRVVKDVRNSVNRQVNCETANLHKTVSTGMNQVKGISWLRDNGYLSALPPSLREMADLRLANPDASLETLGELLKPPIGKSGVNHRLRRIDAMIKQLQQEKEK